MGSKDYSEETLVEREQEARQVFQEDRTRLQSQMMLVGPAGKKHWKGQPPSSKVGQLLSLPRHVSHINTHRHTLRR